MKVVDLHPEDLLDKEARDEISDDERVRLDAHLARCSACRAERLLRADFAADFAGELDEDERPSGLHGLVQGALVARQPAPVAPEKLEAREEEQELVVVPGLRRRPRRTMAFLLVAAAVLAASAAGATGLTGRVWLRITARNGQEATHSTATSAPKAAPVATGRPGVARGPAGVGEAPAIDDVSTDSVIVPSAPVDPAPTLPPATPAVLAPSPALALAPAVAPALAPAPAAANAPMTAAALFEAANTARRTGDTNGALARYDALDTQFPGSREARVAKATAGRLLLDRGDAAGALSRFDAYLASGSTELREEAMAGRATSLERLGRSDEESRAWAALLASYPGTPYAAHAKARVSRGLERSLPQ
jgi:anti-sigma factor RsiW